MDVLERLHPLASALAGQHTVEAAVVVGSHSSGFADQHSDIDLFIYVIDTAGEQEVRAMRADLADRLADRSKPCILKQTGHEYADTWVLRGIDAYLDLMFWPQKWAEDELNWRLVHHSKPPSGASTAFWRSIRDGRPLFHRTSWLARLQERAHAAYPDQLRENIMRHNLDLLGHENPFSFSHQTEKAIAERDPVAAQQYCAKWLEAYFDLLFAANRVLHPGAKRLIQFAERECERLPPGLAEDVAALTRLACSLSPDTGSHMRQMLRAVIGAVGGD